MHKRKFTQHKINKVQEDIEFGNLQASCSAITFWNILFVVVGIAMFIGCLNYMMNELRSYDETGRLFCIAGLIGSLGFSAYGVFNILKNRVDFFEYGLTHRKERILYDNIKGIYAKRVITAGRNFVSARMMYALKANDGPGLTLDSDDFRGLNDLMSDLSSELDMPIEKF